MAFGKGWNDGWWRDAWRYDWGKAKGRGRKGESVKGESKRESARDGKGESARDGLTGVKERLPPEAVTEDFATRALPPPPPMPPAAAAPAAPEAPAVAPVPPRASKEETPAPRAKDEVFEEIRHVLNANPALQIQFFDARVRQHLHALLGNGGRQRLKAALNMVHTCTMHKTRQDVKNWPAYLLTLLKKFDADVAHQEPSDRRVAAAKIALEAKTGASSASTTPEKGTDDALRAATESSEELSAFAEFELPSLGLEGLESDDEPQPSLELKAPRVTAPPPKPRQNDMGFDWGFQEHPAHPGHLHAMRDLDMQGHHSRLRDAETQERRPLDFQASATSASLSMLLHDDMDMQGYVRPAMQEHPAHPGHLHAMRDLDMQGHHSRLRDAETQERRPLDFQGRPYGLCPGLPLPGPLGHHGLGSVPLGPDFGHGGSDFPRAVPNGHAHGPRHVPNGMHAVTYGGHRNRPEASRLAKPGVGGTSNFPAQRSEVVAR